MYHDYEKDGKNKSDMDVESHKSSTLEPDEHAMILSTRIRVGRNLEGYPLGPGLSN